MTIRKASKEDAREILDIYSYYVENTAISFEIETPDVSEFEKRIEATLERYPYIVAVDEGRITGYAYAGPFGKRKAYIPSAELSIYVKKDLRGKGTGHELYSALEDILISQNIYTAYAIITFSEDEFDPYLTDASIKFHSAQGFEIKGRYEKCGNKFNRWYGTVVMEKILIKREGEIKKFIPFPELNIT